ncbi:MAG TPA: PAS domain S-box protein, partial [Azospirillaceae bacterium]|nr:PAS domain S-box protein [Azospirillaceae bacterium]
MTGAAADPGLDFLAGGGEMGARMRAHRWSATPLGDPGTWPLSLRLVVSLVLSSRQAMFLIWGPELAFLYNDHYVPILGAKDHGAVLGRPFREAWADAWDQVRPLVERGLRGEAVWYEDLSFVLERRGYPEEAWFTFSYTPVRDEQGRVAGILCVVTETTAKVLADRNDDFRLSLERRIRALSDPDEIIAAAEEALGRHLGVSRVGYGMVDAQARYFTTLRNWTDGTVQPGVGTHDLAAFGPDVLAALRRGEPLVIGDAATDPRTAAPGIQAAFAGLEMSAALTASLVKDGRMVAALYVHDRNPRRWRADEAALVLEVAERTWSALERARAEAANAHFAAVVASTGDGIMSFDLDGVVLSWNPGAERLFGYPPQEALGRHVSFLVPERLRAEPGPFFTRVGAGETVQFQSTRRRRDGSEFEAAVTLSPIRGADGAIIGVSAIARDVTEEQRAAEALRASEERLRIAQKAGGVGTFELRGDGTLAVSEEFCRIWGIEPRPVVSGDELAAIIHPEDRARLTATTSGAPAQDGLGHAEYRITRPDTGELRWIARRGESVPGPGGTTRVLGVCYDVTDWRLAEEGLRELNATLEQRVADALAERKLWADIVESTDAPISALDHGYRFVAFNRAYAGEFARIYGVAPQLGARLDTLLGHAPEALAAAREVWDRALAGEEFTAVREFGTPGHGFGCYELKFNVLRDRDGKAIGAFQYVRDVSSEREAAAALRRAEEQLRHAQKMEAVGQLTGGVAHDFNNLLQALDGCLSMIARRSEEPRIRPLLEAGQQAVERGAKLVQQLMAFARREGLRPEPIDLRDRVLGMSALLERALRADIRLSTRFPQGLWTIEADPTQFELALINLAVNARDAMPAGGELEVSAENVTLRPGERPGLEGEFVRLSVSDTGTGMPPEVAARAFDPFFTTKEVGKGSGLGLAQVYGLARQAGGTAWIESTPGLGTA